MSGEKNRNDNQDYLDLLAEYANKDVEIKDETIPDNDVDQDGYCIMDAELDENGNERIILPSDYEDYEDVPSQEEEKKPRFGKLSLWYRGLSKGKQLAVKIIAIVLAIVILLSTAAGIFIASKFKKMGVNINEVTEIVEEEEEYEDTIYDEENIGNINVSLSSNFTQALYDWANTGNDRHMRSKNVVNVLLIGADSRKGKNQGNTDVMMVVSVNKKTKKLSLVSFFRDSYLYIKGKKTSYCTKLNAAYSMGGPETLMQTIENNYKIEIDNYVMVNFKSFSKIVDAMGGIKVDVKKYEADHIKKLLKVTTPYGENVKLNGKQALCFARIRKCDADGDISRTRRQRMVIEAMLDKIENASISELNKYIDILLPYVDTGYSKTEILSLGFKAIMGGWAKFERNQLQMPPADCRRSGSVGTWIWVVDYQKAAHILQNELYGQSNIVLKSNRVTLIDVYKGADYDKKKDDKKDNKTETTTKKPDVTQGVTENNVPNTEATTENVTNPTENTTKPTEAPTKPTEAPTKPTEASTKPTEPPAPETPAEQANPASEG